MLGILRPCLTLATAVLLLTAAGADAKSKAPIRVVHGTTISQKVVAEIAALALGKSGFKFEFVSIPDADVPEALAVGKVHVHLTMPAGEEGAALSGPVEAGEIVSLGGLVGNGPDEPVLKIVTGSMKKRWPYAQKMFKRMVIPPETLDALVSEVEAGATAGDVAAAWMKANRKTWQPWVAASKNWMKP